MTNEYLSSPISDIASRLAVDLQELKNLQIDKPAVNDAIEIKARLLQELKEYLETNKDRKKKMGL